MARHGRGAGVFWSLAAALALSCGLAGAAEAPPAAGQTLDEWQNAATAYLASRGDKMGFAVQRCKLTPPFAGAAETYLSRAVSQDKTMELALIAVRDGKVTEWKEFGLPSFQGWFIRALHACKGRFLEIRFDGKLSQRYRWNGQGFAPVPIKRTAR
jgi:hypothetical protein